VIASLLNILAASLMADAAEPVVTQHSMQLHGVKLDYTATAGQLPLKNDDGEPEGRIFFVAYTKPGVTLGTRPITFAYNGGPGSSSIWLHMGTLGPRRTLLNDDGSFPKPPFKLVDNQETWLDDTDVVMVDAMGTGYSRLDKKDLSKKYYSLRGDIAAFGTFIKNYLAKYNRYSSPVFLAGESYGGIRNAGLAAWLLENGVALSGAISISGSTNFQTLDGGRGNDLPFITFLPTMATTAQFHHRLKEKQSLTVEKLATEARNFAEGEYAQALQKGSALSDAEKSKIANRMSEFIGLSPKYILGSNLRIPEFRFFKELMRDENVIIGRYDGRLTGSDSTSAANGPEYDPSDVAITAPMFSTWMSYVRTELNYQTEDRYRIFNDTADGWDNNTEEGYPDTSENLRQVLTQNPYFKVFFAMGYYDFACNFAGTLYSINHSDLGPSQLSRLSYGYYPAGHMMYIDSACRQKLKKDISAFYASCRG
jgi:carboxypeptidase C (cathepsin A)